MGKYGEDDSRTQGYSNWNWLREYRKVKFETSVKELTGMLVFNFRNNNSKKLSAYVFVGAGIAFVNVSRDWSKFDTAYFAVENPSLIADLAKDTVHALPNSAFIIPIGGGLKYAVTSQLSLLFEVNFRYTTQEYLDGFYNVGNNQANKGYNLKKDDYYYGVSFGVSYKLHADGYGRSPKSVRCPKIVW